MYYGWDQMPKKPRKRNDYEGPMKKDGTWLGRASKDRETQEKSQKN